MRAHIHLLTALCALYAGACAERPVTRAQTARLPSGTPNGATQAPKHDADDTRMPRRAFHYPAAKRSQVAETLHGVSVTDPYRWLEQTALPETRAWINAQNELTGSYLAKVPEREAIKQRLTELWDIERFDVPQRRGGRYFYTYNSGLQNQPALYWLSRLSAEPKLLLDPSSLAADGTVALKGLVPSPSGRFVAYGLAHAGSDWTEWKIRRVDTGTDLPDQLRWTKFSGVSWLKDESGLFYSRYAEPEAGAALEQSNYYNKLYFHRLGQAQAQDRLIYERSDHKEWAFDGHVTDDGQFLIITVNKGTDPKHAVLYQDLRATKQSPTELIMDFGARYEFVGSRGKRFWFHTDLNAPQGRVVALDLGEPGRLHEVIPESAATLIGVERIGGKFVANLLRDAHSELKVFADNGQLEHEIELEGMGTARGPIGEAHSSEAFFSFESYTEPRTIYRYALRTKAKSVFRKPKLRFEPSAYETRQVFYESKDGTRIPMFLTRKRSTELSKATPCLLFGYGGFGISLTPAFAPENLAWLELGGLLAVPNLRGGGEYGEAWHDAGKKLAKQNVFDDFIAAAEYLIAQGFTSPAKLALQGRSNGGLLVGALLTQRPDLFAAALPGVGVLDMLRFHKFTIGWAWTDDYGSPDDAREFSALLAYSPLHNVKPGTRFPATLITTADHDDRVVPAHSFKFAATLQAAQAGDAPVLIRIETRAGHGSGKPTSMRIAEVADQLAFLYEELKLRPTPQ